MCNNFTRRGFLVGCSAAIAGMAGARFDKVAFGAPGDNEEIFVLIFLRGGMDGLSLVPPIAGADRGHYEAARSSLQIPVSGPGAAINLNGQFGLHPAAAPLYDIYQDGKLAIVQAVGMSDVVNKSHFDAMQFVELGTPGSATIDTGWLTRHLQTASNLPADVVMESLSVGDLQPASLLGSYTTVNVDDPYSFNIDNGPWPWRDAQRVTLRNIYESSSSWLHDASLGALDAIDIVSLNIGDSYTPTNGAVYPESPFGDQLQVLAQMIKLDLGLQVATIDIGGWDTHETQGDGSEGYLAEAFADLAAGMAAFYADLNGSGGSNYTQRLTVAVQSEFGRELHQNGDSGTEHGYGNQMMVMSGNAIGGIHGSWPGLAPGQLTDGTDLSVTTDYRQVMSEILTRRLGNTALDQIFPGYTGYQPLGVVQGSDPAPESIFADGFETGGAERWDASSG